MASMATEAQILGLAAPPSSSPGTTSPAGLLSDASKHWPIFFLRGIILFVLGTAFIWFPEETVNTVSILFGVMLLFEGFNAGIQMCALCTNTGHNPLGGAMAIFYFFLMLINLGLGITVITYPDESAQVLVILVAVYFVVMGFMEVLFVCCLRRSGDLQQRPGAMCCMLLGGVLYLTFGISMLSDLDEGMEVFATLIGIVTMLFAMQIMCFACLLKAAGNAVEQQKQFDDELKLNEGIKTDPTSSSNDGAEESEIL